MLGHGPSEEHIHETQKRQCRPNPTLLDSIERSIEACKEKRLRLMTRIPRRQDEREAVVDVLHGPCSPHQTHSALPEN